MWSTVGLNVQRGRILGAQRAERERWPAWRRVLQAAAFPLFPLLQLRHLLAVDARLPVPAGAACRGCTLGLGARSACSRSPKRGACSPASATRWRAWRTTSCIARGISRRASARHRPLPRPWADGGDARARHRRHRLHRRCGRAATGARRPRRARARARTADAGPLAAAGIDVVRGDVRDADAVALAVRGCSHVIHLAAAKSGALAHAGRRQRARHGERDRCRAPRRGCSASSSAARSACTAS